MCDAIRSHGRWNRDETFADVYSRYEHLRPIVPAYDILRANPCAGLLWISQRNVVEDAWHSGRDRCRLAGFTLVSRYYQMSRRILTSILMMDSESACSSSLRDIANPKHYSSSFGPSSQSADKRTSFFAKSRNLPVHDSLRIISSIYLLMLYTLLPRESRTERFLNLAGGERRTNSARMICYST
jgi:hypothetical protein